MTKQQIDTLIAGGTWGQQALPVLVETHISWVILCNSYAYKIKKPVQYSFLDFSTPEKRKYYCEREIVLNKRLTENMYIAVEPVRQNGQLFSIGGAEGDVIDYAVKMHKMNRSLQMDVLLRQNKVTAGDIRQLAEKIAGFHQHTTVIYNTALTDIQQQYNDLAGIKDFAGKQLGSEFCSIIEQALNTADAFIKNNRTLLQKRMQSGFYRDGHGDLHTGNIFLLPAPLPFDCIEFNDAFRQMDVLNEIAFLCMDLEAQNRQDFSRVFAGHYNQLFPSISTANEELLLTYYKSYRANIRAKVNCIRAGSAADAATQKESLAQTKKYLKLLDRYTRLLKGMPAI